MCRSNIGLASDQGKSLIRRDKNFQYADFIRNHSSEWSTRTFNLGLQLDPRCDLGRMLDQLEIKRQNPSGLLENGRDEWQLDEYEFESTNNEHTCYFKCDLACPGLRLVRETEIKGFGGSTYAEFMVYMKFGDIIVSSWRRFNDFKLLADNIDLHGFPRVRKQPHLLYSTIDVCICLRVYSVVGTHM